MTARVATLSPTSSMLHPCLPVIAPCASSSSAGACTGSRLVGWGNSKAGQLVNTGKGLDSWQAERLATVGHQGLRIGGWKGVEFIHLYKMRLPNTDVGCLARVANWCAWPASALKAGCYQVASAIPGSVTEGCWQPATALSLPLRPVWRLQLHTHNSCALGSWQAAHTVGCTVLGGKLLPLRTGLKAQAG